MLPVIAREDASSQEKEICWKAPMESLPVVVASEVSTFGSVPWNVHPVMLEATL